MTKYDFFTRPLSFAAVNLCIRYVFNTKPAIIQSFRFDQKAKDMLTNGSSPEGPPACVKASADRREQWKWVIILFCYAMRYGLCDMRFCS
jgi:hypothetical protein